MDRQKYVAVASKPRRRGAGLIKTGLLILGGMGIFWLGIGVGSGRIGPDAIFHKPVARDLPTQLHFSNLQQLY